MKFRKLLYTLICIFLLGQSFSFSVFAYNAGEKGGHNDITRRILFGETGYVSNTDAFDALNDAVALSVDQFNKSGDNYLTELRDTFKITGLPKTVSEFDFTANSTSHRWYTHQGWDYKYTEDRYLDDDLVKKSNFDLRKKILLTTVNQTFDFGLLSGKLFFGYADKCIAFSRLLYYVHILGDYEEIYQKDFAYSNHRMIPLIKVNNQFGLIEEFEDCFEILFADQKDSRVYGNLKTELEKLKKDIATIYSGESDLSGNPDKYRRYAGYSHDLLSVLIDSVPLLLKKEEFFQKVFYKNMVQGS